MADMADMADDANPPVSRFPRCVAELGPQPPVWSEPVARGQKLPGNDPGAGGQPSFAPTQNKKDCCLATTVARSCSMRVRFVRDVRHQSDKCCSQLPNYRQHQINFVEK